MHRTRCLGCVVLPIEDKTGSLELQPSAWILAAGCSLDVQHRYLWVIQDFPPGLLDPICPINILPIHPECFVEQTNCFNGLAPYHHERANYTVYLSFNVLIKVRHVIAPE